MPRTTTTPSRTPPPRRLSQVQAARFLGLRPRTLATWRHLGKGPRYVKIGGRVAYWQSDLEQWLRGRTVDPARRGRRSRRT